ncbi:MAG TPA: hypothetical protein VE912_01120 [Bacteroidales bacterium]|nr:hypothetical protein [Bacteroidales bacterium]
MELQVPILFIIFNRPNTTSKVFEQIKKVRPRKIYIAADGPRKDHPDEVYRCKKVRSIINYIDWDCELKTLFQNKNLGCKHGVSSAINWFFLKEEMGIILEDDCLPNISFFKFCEEILEKYKYDKRVMQVNGNNYGTDLENYHAYSYGFSSYPQVWGWATWKRAWKYYDLGLTKWPSFLRDGLLSSLDGGAKFSKTRIHKWDSVYKDKIDTWDYQWHFAVMSQSGLSVVPQKNLITNIGFSSDATHTNDGKDAKANIQNCDIEFPLKHPPFMIADDRIDRIYRKNMLGRTYSEMLIDKIKKIALIHKYK